MNSSNEISENAWMLETIFDHTHFMIAYMDKNFNFIRVNEAYAKKSNKTPDFFEGKNHFDLYPHKGNEAIFKNVIETGKPYFSYSMPLEHPELGITYWDWVIQPVKEDGQIKGILLSLTDVTEYKRNEENIHENQGRFMEELVEKRANELLMEQEESSNLEIDKLNQKITELKKSNDKFKEIISNYEISEKEEDEFAEKLGEENINEILEKQKEAEESLKVKELEIEKKDQKIAELGNINDEFKEIISKYEDSKIENEKFIENLIETHAKELEYIKEQEDAAIKKLIETHAKELEDFKENENTPEMFEDQSDLINNINDAVIVIDSKLRIKMWNKAAQKIYGWKENDAIGKIVYEVFKSKNTPMERLKILEYLQNNEYLNSEFIHHDKNGKLLNINSVITVKRNDNGSIVEYIAVNQDVSELKNAEELLSDSNLEIKELNQNLAEFKKTNAEFKEIISNYKISEKLVEKRFNEALRKQKTAKELLSAQRLKTEKLNHEIAGLENINEELRARISKLEDSAESQSAIHEKQLKRAMDDLKHSNEELQQFAYIASHDLQEPLRTISSFTQLLAKRYKNKLDKDGWEFIEYTIEASTRMQQMIKDLLQYSRVVSRGKEFKPTNTEEIMEYTISSLQTQIEDEDAKITYDQLPGVTADSGQLLQLFRNLIGNAIKFRQFQVPPKIHISAVKDENSDEYIFSVADNGIGIEEEYFERIFTIFQRLHTRKEYSGTGIGLSVAKRIVERHEGKIWVESEPDVGSVFYFTIPIKQI